MLGLDPAEDINSALASIDVIQVPLAAPQNARIVNRPRIFADPATGALAGLSQGGTSGPGTQASRQTDQCHDITVFAELGLAAGACEGNGLLLDISDPRNPVRLDYVADKNFAYWHSATFNNDGTKVVFTDEWGGGTRPRCGQAIRQRGARMQFSHRRSQVRFAGYYKLPGRRANRECVAHNGSIIPVPGRDIMVQAGTRVVCRCSTSLIAHPVEIAFFDRGPLDPTQLIRRVLSTYVQRLHLRHRDRARPRIFRLTPACISRRTNRSAMMVRGESSTHSSSRASHGRRRDRSRCYLDQLTRTKAIKPARVSAWRRVARGDALRTGRPRDAAARLERLDALATQLRAMPRQPQAATRPECAHSL